MIYGLDLFSGIGGIGVGLKDYVRTIAYCEQDKYAQGVLLSRMQSGDVDRAPIFQDVRQLSKKNFATKPDIIFGGFPCQDISVAGAGKGLEGERSGLFFEIVRLTQEIKPTFVFLENVPAIRTRGLREVIRAFTEIGYDCRWTCLSAASVGALHKRERWFLLAYVDRGGLRLEQGRIFEKGKSSHELELDGSKRFMAYSSSFGWQKDGPWESILSSKAMANSNSIRKQSKQDSGKISSCRSCDGGKNENAEGWWTVEPNVGRVAHGIPFRVDRIKCLGNSVVPAQVKKAFESLLGIST